MTVDQLVNMNDKSRRRGFWIGALSGFALGAGLALTAAIFVMFKFAHEIMGLLG